MPLSLILERLQYILSGLLNTIISTVLILNKKSIVSTYDAIQTNFVQWSKIRGVDPNVAYEKSLKTFKNFMKFYPVIMCFISLGPFLSAIHDFEKIPLDSQTHFSLFWPKVKYSKRKYYLDLELGGAGVPLGYLPDNLIYPSKIFLGIFQPRRIMFSLDTFTSPVRMYRRRVIKYQRKFLTPQQGYSSYPKRAQRFPRYFLLCWLRYFSYQELVVLIIQTWNVQIWKV